MLHNFLISGDLNGRSLSTCLDYFFQEGTHVPHNASKNADDCRRISEEAAKNLGYVSLKQYIVHNRERTKTFDEI